MQQSHTLLGGILITIRIVFISLLAGIPVSSLLEFPELEGIEVIAGEGHLLKAACHAPRDTKGRKVAPNTIHMLNVRNCLMLSLAPVKGDGRHAHELPALRRHLPAFLQNNAVGCNPLLYRIRIPTQFSCQLILSLRNAIDARKRLIDHLPAFRAVMESYI